MLLIQAHVVEGADVCKCITPDVLDVEVERMSSEINSRPGHFTRTLIGVDCNCRKVFTFTCQGMKTLSIERPHTVPQNLSQFDSGITIMLLIHAHVVEGADVCKCITPDVLDVEVKRMSVMIYEDNLGVL
ncbi:hypothetical protein F2Q69_00011308 [Brassica cretica]|uniref:Uncharacterized protein n=1 Tax=Brassica cretica TaxID=69181 RepID=A0A8S9QMW7_BRACR|nr:hypothetical protein F2Q69_00011308 [Brassica cretica]